MSRMKVSKVNNIIIISFPTVNLSPFDACFGRESITSYLSYLTTAGSGGGGGSAGGNILRMLF